MNLTKKFSTLLIVIMIAGIIVGCPARKPEQEPAPQEPERIIVPEVSRIFFEEIPLEEGPRMARQLVNNNREGEMTVWFVEENEYWVLAHTEDNALGQLEVVEVLQRIPDVNRSLIEVRFVRGEAGEVVEEDEEEENNEENGNNDDGVMLIRLDLNNEPHGVAFLIGAELEEDLESEVANENGEGQQRQQGGQQAQQQQQQQQQPAPRNETRERQERQQDVTQTVELQEPSPNKAVSGEITVRGRGRVQGDKVKVRLCDENGQSLIENTTTISAAYPQMGSFDTKLTYTSTQGEGKKGKIEVISPASEEVLAAVPVVIK
ncbi:hypothetical protein GGQ84_002877 [Desulfitispora alkaliphila]|uniref:Gmad2 immunoglobulin-like domain-containing protein n=1 Tax=Desulfitispora alkaliphila TaxID=622674 RepID=UPI003D24608B